MNESDDRDAILIDTIDRSTAGGGTPGATGDTELDALVQLGVWLRGAPDPAFKRWLKDSLIAMTPERRALGPAAKIGVIADTHGCREDGSDLPEQVLDAFAGVDLIVHCGDIGNLAILDRLETVAPVLALRGEADPPTADARVVSSPHRLEAGGVRVGIIFDLASLGASKSTADVPPPERLASAFGGPVDVVVSAASHRETVAARGGVLLVNPGSPTLPAAPRAGELGTVAVLDIRDGTVVVEVVRLRKAVTSDE